MNGGVSRWGCVRFGVANLLSFRASSGIFFPL
jgi:hypothetical protein